MNPRRRRKRKVKRIASQQIKIPVSIPLNINTSFTIPNVNPEVKITEVRNVIIAKPTIPTLKTDTNKAIIIPPLNKIWLYHPEKTAGKAVWRSIIDAIVRQQNVDMDPMECYYRLEKENFNIGNINTKDLPILGGHIPWHDRDPCEHFNCRWRVGIFRDPIDRAISNYREILVLILRTPKNKYGQENKKFVENGFLYYIRNTPKSILLRQLYFYSSTFSIEEALGKIKKLDGFIRKEHYNSDIQILSSILKIDIQPIQQVSNEIFVPYDSFKAEVEPNLEELYDILVPEYDLLNRAGFNYIPKFIKQ